MNNKNILRIIITSLVKSPHTFLSWLDNYPTYSYIKKTFEIIFKFLKRDIILVQEFDVFLSMIELENNIISNKSKYLKNDKIIDNEYLSIISKYHDLDKTICIILLEKIKFHLKYITFFNTHLLCNYVCDHYIICNDITYCYLLQLVLNQLSYHINHDIVHKFAIQFNNFLLTQGMTSKTSDFIELLNNMIDTYNINNFSSNNSMNYLFYMTWDSYHIDNFINRLDDNCHNKEYVYKYVLYLNHIGKICLPENIKKILMKKYLKHSFNPILHTIFNNKEFETYIPEF